MKTTTQTYIPFVTYEALQLAGATEEQLDAFACKFDDEMPITRRNIEDATEVPGDANGRDTGEPPMIWLDTLAAAVLPGDLMERIDRERDAYRAGLDRKGKEPLPHVYDSWADIKRRVRWKEELLKIANA